MTRLPQVLLNVRVARRDGADSSPAVLAAVEAVEAELAGQGRVLLRPSGTEPVVRVMVEAPSQHQADAAARRLAAAVEAGATP
jgi:phosphoglucosamine mutase